jgi:hypothetical protein
MYFIDDSGVAFFVDASGALIWVDDAGLVLGGRQFAIHFV